MLNDPKEIAQIASLADAVSRREKLRLKDRQVDLSFASTTTPAATAAAAVATLRTGH